MAWLDGYFFNPEDQRAQQAYAALGQAGLSLMAAGQRDPAGVQRGLAGAMAAPYAVQDQQQQAKLRDQQMAYRQRQMDALQRQAASQDKLATLLAGGKKIDDPEVTAQILQDPDLYQAYVRSKLSARDSGYSPKIGWNPETKRFEYVQFDASGATNWLGISPPTQMPGTVYDENGGLVAQPGALPFIQQKTAASQPAVVPFKGTDPSGREVSTFIPNPAALGGGGRVTLQDLAPIGGQPAPGGGATLVGPTPGERAQQTAEVTNIPEAVRTRYQERKAAIDKFEQSMADYALKYANVQPGFWEKLGDKFVDIPELSGLDSALQWVIRDIGGLANAGVIQPGEIPQLKSMIPDYARLRGGQESFLERIASVNAGIARQREENENMIRNAAPLSARPSTPSSSRLNDLDKKYGIK